MPPSQNQVLITSLDYVMFRICLSLGCGRVCKSSGFANQLGIKLALSVYKSRYVLWRVPSATLQICAMSIVLGLLADCGSCVTI